MLHKELSMVRLGAGSFRFCGMAFANDGRCYKPDTAGSSELFGPVRPATSYKPAGPVSPSLPIPTSGLRLLSSLLDSCNVRSRSCQQDRCSSALA